MVCGHEYVKQSPTSWGSLCVAMLSDMIGLAGYDTFGANASGIDWLGNAQNAHHMMSRYWANSTAETDCLCGGGCVWSTFGQTLLRS
jgi:hypothetical protein